MNAGRQVEICPSFGVVQWAAFKEAPNGGFSLERRLSQVAVLSWVHVDHKSVTNYSDGSQHESPDGETIHFVKPLFMELP